MRIRAILLMFTLLFIHVQAVDTSSMSYSQYFKTLYQANYYATRRYFVPELLVIRNWVSNGMGYNYLGSFFSNEMANAYKYLYDLCLFRGKSDLQIASSYVIGEALAQNAHQDSDGNNEMHDTVSSFVKNPDVCHSPLDDNNRISPDSFKQAVSRADLPIKKHINRKISHGYAQNEVQKYNKKPPREGHKGDVGVHADQHITTLKKLPIDAGGMHEKFLECFFRHKAYESVSPTIADSLNAQEKDKLFSDCSREKVQEMLRNYAAARRKYSDGTNRKYQDEIEDIFQSDHPDNEFIKHNWQDAESGN